MNVLALLIQSIDTLLQNDLPTLDAIGYRVFVGFLTMMFVWIGVKGALSSAQGGPGVNFAEFTQFILLGSFGYAMIQFYSNPLPAIGLSFEQLISQEATSLSITIGNDGLDRINTTINNIQQGLGSGIVATSMSVYYTLVYYTIQLVLIIFSAVSIAVIGYGLVAGAIAALLGPIFIPFFIVPKLDFLFWGWLRAFIGFSFYKVVAAAALNILGRMLTLYSIGNGPIGPADLVAQLPLLGLLVLICIYVLLKIPSITASILSGYPAGGDIIGAIVSGVRTVAALAG